MMSRNSQRLRLASRLLGLGACLMLFAACSTEVVDESIDESDLGYVEEELTGAVGTIESRYYWDVRCLDVAGASWYPGTKVQQWGCNNTYAQKFVAKQNSDNTFTFYVYGVYAGKSMCLDVAGASKANGAQVQIWTCNGTDAQKFYVLPTSNGFEKIINANSYKCLDLDGPSPGPWGSKLQQWDCHNGYNQQFWFTAR
jgi:hypothetical protein